MSRLSFLDIILGFNQSIFNISKHIIHLWLIQGKDKKATGNESWEYQNQREISTWHSENRGITLRPFYQMVK